MPSDSFYTRLEQVVGSRGIATSPEALAPYLTERRGNFSSTARCVVFPQSSAEVAEIVKTCAAEGVGIVPQGGNTGLCGAGVADAAQVIVNLKNLNRIRALDSMNHTVTVDAGCILGDIQTAAQDAGCFFPLSLGAEGTCQIGGNLSTNAGGINVVRYGNARDLVLGLEVVLPDGSVLDNLLGLRKNNSGYDLKQLFIGAEGTLGIITAAVLRLFPQPTAFETAFVGLSNLESSVAFLAQQQQASGEFLSSFELIPRIALEFACRHIEGCRDPLSAAHDWYILLNLASTRPGQDLRSIVELSLEVAARDELISDAVIASSQSQSDALWRIRGGLVEAQKYEGASLKHDVSVGVSDVPRYLTNALSLVEEILPGTRPYPFGHLGDGNIHLNLSQPVGMEPDAFLAFRETFSDRIHELTVEMGGSFSAEHGIGLLKLEEMRRFKSTVELKLMKQIKRAIDPQDLMNPGKVIPD